MLNLQNCYEMLKEKFHEQKVEWQVYAEFSIRDFHLVKAAID